MRYLVVLMLVCGCSSAPEVVGSGGKGLAKGGGESLPKVVKVSKEPARKLWEVFNCGGVYWEQDMERRKGPDWERAFSEGDAQ